MLSSILVIRQKQHFLQENISLRKPLKKEDQATDTNPPQFAEGQCSASLRSFDSNAGSTKNANRVRHE